MVRYLCVKFQRLTSFDWQDISIYIKVGDPRTKKNNSSWNTHPINLRFCGSLRIMLRYHRVKFQRLASFGWQDILIYCLSIPKYLCKSERSKNKKNE